MLEAITGARMTYNYVRIGGVWADLPVDIEKKCKMDLVNLVDCIMSL